VSAGNGVNPKRRKSTRPYRDSVLAYAALGSLVVIFAYVTGSSLLRSLAGGVTAFVLATAYTWLRLRARQRRAEQQP
jgi:predicted PurR-regulated permease PerM